MKRSRWTTAILQAPIIVVLLLSFFLRIYRLDAQSLWYDEGNSAVMAARSIPQIIVNAAADIHPPLYYMLLHWWSQAAGTSEFALRYLSVAFGMLAVAAVVALGRRFWGSAVGIVAGALAAISPFLVYYAQEARMYAQLCALASLSTYAFIRLAGIGAESSPPGTTSAVERINGEPGKAAPSRTSSDSRPDRSQRNVICWQKVLLPIAYILITAALLYTHYFAFSILLVQVVLSLVLVLRRYPLQSVARLCLAQAMALLLYIPWLPALFRQLGAWSTSATHTSLDALLQNVFLVFSFGLSWDATTTGRSQLFIGILLAAGMVADLIRRRSTSGFSMRYWPAVLLFLLVPLGVVSIQEMRQPTYQPKLVIPAAIAFELLLAAGIVGIGTLVSHVALGWRVGTQWLPSFGRGWRKPGITTADRSRRPTWDEGRRAALAVATAALMLALVGFLDSRSLRAYYFDPKYGRDDYRGVARLLEAQGTDGDAIVLNAPNQIEVLDYYYDGTLPRHPVPRQRPLDTSVTENDLTGLVGSYNRIWVVEWAVNESDPEGFIEAWLGRRYGASVVGQFGQVRLLLYDLQAERTASN